ncbi:ArsC/Spx/MgsR family protein [Salinicola acroporae]|uniref:ArsC/Spx/MgsR family protein n=1 Tax=Salinicola acroporae TaxID=1541440 RepID=UPI0024551EFD|nr:ArsC/Spx/MgsR family protein [Salinicola acroporae]
MRPSLISRYNTASTPLRCPASIDGQQHLASHSHRRFRHTDVNAHALPQSALLQVTRGPGAPGVAGVEFAERRYLDDPLSRQQLEGLSRRLGDDADQMLRREEPEWRARGIVDPTQAQIIDAIVEHPRLMQRPIADDGEYAVIGRPPQAVLQLI